MAPRFAAYKTQETSSKSLLFNAIRTTVPSRLDNTSIDTASSKGKGEAGSYSPLTPVIVFRNVVQLHEQAVNLRVNRCHPLVHASFVLRQQEPDNLPLRSIRSWANLSLYRQPRCAMQVSEQHLLPNQSPRPIETWKSQGLLFDFHLYHRAPWRRL